MSCLWVHAVGPCPGRHHKLGRCSSTLRICCHLPAPTLQNRPRHYITLALFLLSLAAAPLCLLWNACCLAAYPATLLGLCPLAWAVTPRSLYRWLHLAFVKTCSEWRALANAHKREVSWGRAWRPGSASTAACWEERAQRRRCAPLSSEWLGTARYCEGEAEQPRFESGDYIASTGG